MTTPLNRTGKVTFAPSDSLQQEKLLLDIGYRNKCSVSLVEQDTFTCNTLQELIEEAKGAQKDYIFVLAEDDSNKISFFDGTNFCEWISKSESLINPLTKLDIIDVYFYIVPKNVSLQEIKERVPASYLCNLKEYLDFEQRPFFYHIIDRSNPEDTNRNLLNYNLVLDIFFERGIVRNDVEAFKLAESFAKLGNRYCKLLMALLYNKGIGIFQPNKDLGKAYYLAAESLFDSSESAFIYYRTLEKQFDERQSPKNPTLGDEYRSQSLYSFI